MLLKFFTIFFNSIIAIKNMKKLKTLIVGLTGIAAVHATTPALADVSQTMQTMAVAPDNDITMIIDALTKLVIAVTTLYHLFKGNKSVQSNDDKPRSL